MKWKLLAFVLLLSFSRSANSADTPEPVVVDGICGRLVSFGQAPEKETTNSAPREVKPLPHIRIRLFSPSIDCCALVTPVAEVTTGSDGNFQFRKPEPGDYWLVAGIGQAEYKVMVRYTPGKKASTKCSTFLYVFDKGKLQFRTADALTAN